MLQRVFQEKQKIDPLGAVVPVGKASFPVPFRSQLEFNAPVHGPWNIVHVAMLVPECHQIYVCADNCMRGVVLTAAEMGAADRFSCVLLEEDDLFEGNLETITIEGVTDAIRRLPYRPRAVALFLVCLHHFVGTDTSFVYQTLEERFPDIDFMRCWMDPVMQKTGPAPEAKLKHSMFRPVRSLPADPRMICLAGDNQPLDPDSDLSLLIRNSGFRTAQLQDCESYDDYLAFGAGSVFITRNPSGIHGVTQLARRLGRPFLYLPPACGAQEIREELDAVRAQMEKIREQYPEEFAGADPAGKTGLNRKESSDDPQQGKTNDGSSLPGKAVRLPSEEDALRALAHARELIGNTEVTVDYFATPRPLSLSRLLLENGFHVTCVYLDAILPEEENDFLWLQEHHPRLLLSATIHPKMRVLHAPENAGSMLAIGPKAAWFGGTRHFVNTVDYSGMWGFSGIVKLAALMEDAFLHEKDTRELVPRKGFGCTCVL